MYRTLIDEGLEAVMVGHIALPEMSRKLRPGIQDKEIKPATMAPELLTDLLPGDFYYDSTKPKPHGLASGSKESCRSAVRLSLDITAKIA